MYIDFDRLNPGQAYHTLIQTVLPRPIAWVLTENKNGTHNLAPFSFFNAVSSQPPLLAITLGPKAEGVPKDTLANIEQRGNFVIHIPHPEQAEQVDESGRALAAGHSEVEHIGLPVAPLDDFPLPRLRDCRVAFGCERFEVHPIVGGTQQVILGRVRVLYVADELTHRDEQDRLFVDPVRLDPLARLGGHDYATLGRVFTTTPPRSK